MKNPLGLNWFKGAFKQFAPLNKGIVKFISLSLAMLLAITATVTVFTAQPATAIDEIRITYGAVNLPITIDELVTFANTGQQSDQLRSLFLTANADNEAIAQVREILNYTVRVDSNIVDEVLDSRYGRMALQEFSRYFAPGSEVDSIVNDVIDTIDNVMADGEIKVLEVVRRFKWTDAIVIDGEGIANFFGDAIKFGQGALELIKEQPAVQRIICDS